MGASPSVPELVAAAQATAKASQDRVIELRGVLEGQAGSPALIDELHTATAAVAAAAIDVFSAFEARMQHHFRRGPFSRKLIALLTGAEKHDLAERIRQYYLAVNVLKHGKGASFQELVETPNAIVVMHPDADADRPASLIDVTAPGFFDGLAATILEAYHFLEDR